MSKSPATCDGCGKVWQVADAARTYRCRACGGNVRAAPARASFEPAPAEWQENVPPPPATITCALCKSANDAEQRFCIECGAPLSEAAAVPASAAAPGDRVDAGIRSREIKSARETLHACRALFLSNACVMLLLAVAGLIKDVPVVVVGLLAGMCAIYAVAGIRISREPFFWSVLAAALMTLNWASFVWFIVTAGWSYSAVRWIVLIGGWVVAGWVLVTAVARSRQLIADNPGLMKTPKGVRGPQHRRAVAEPHSWRMAVIVLLVVGVAWGAWVSMDTGKKPPVAPPLDATASEFLQAWNASRHADVKNMLPEKVREMAGRQLDVVIKRRGWTAQLPKISLFKIEYPGDGRAYAVFPMEDGEIETRWRFEDGRWWLSSLRPLP